MTHRILILPIVAALLVGRAPGGETLSGKGREIGRTTERELKVVISAAFGTLKILRGEPEKILIAEPRSVEDDPLTIHYAVRNGIGYLDLSLGKSESDRTSGGESESRSLRGGTWTLRFTTAIPVAFDIEQAVGKGVYDLSGLQVRDFNLNSGASDVTLRFDQPNAIEIDNISIESGVSRFSGKQLGNANFKRFRFQGGVGSSTLDFSGALEREVDVDVEMALGAITLVIPPETGARVFYEEGWLSHIDYERDFRRVEEHQYTSENFATARGRMNIRIDAGPGSVKLRRP